MSASHIFFKKQEKKFIKEELSKMGSGKGDK